MKFANNIVIVLLLISCQNSDFTKKHSFTLIDRDSLLLGVVTCKLPSDFDTTYTWLISSDCDCCDAIMYRSHSSKFEVVTESGFLSIAHLDSGFYFTISHFPSIDCDTSREYYFSGSQASSDAYKKRFEQSINQLEESGGTTVIVDTARVINKNVFDIVYFTEKGYYKVQENDSSMINTVTFNYLAASTKYKGRHISFGIQSNIHKRDSFYIIAMNILKSVHIE